MSATSFTCDFWPHSLANFWCFGVYIYMVPEDFPHKLDLKQSNHSSAMERCVILFRRVLRMGRPACLVCVLRGEHKSAGWIHRSKLQIQQCHTAGRTNINHHSSAKIIHWVLCTSARASVNTSTTKRQSENDIARNMQRQISAPETHTPTPMLLLLLLLLLLLCLLHLLLLHLLLLHLLLLQLLLPRLIWSATPPSHAGREQVQLEGLWGSVKSFQSPLARCWRILIPWSSEHLRTPYLLVHILLRILICSHWPQKICYSVGKRRKTWENTWVYWKFCTCKSSSILFIFYPTQALQENQMRLQASFPNMGKVKESIVCPDPC